MLQHSSLESHKIKKGRFITPFNAAFGDLLKEQSWAVDRLPEYLWIGLILKRYGRNHGFYKVKAIFEKLVDLGIPFDLPFFSNILNLNNEKQDVFWQFAAQVIERDVLEPLTVIFPFRDYPEFNKSFQGSTEIKNCVTALQDILEESMDNGTDFATDMRYCVLLFLNIKRKFSLEKHQAELLVQYHAVDHSSEIMRMIRPLIRNCEMTLSTALTEDGQNEHNQSALFWERISVMTDCQLFCISYQSLADKADLYQEYLHEVFQYLEETFVATEPLNKKHLVILGMATFAYKRLKELIEHQLYNEISGRSIIRNLIEIYIMLKYLLKHEGEKKDIWNDYQYYGMGLYKLIVEKNRSHPCTYTDGHVNYEIIELLVHEYRDEEFLDMDVRYFGNMQIRQKAEEVDEKELYGLFYDYDSSFEHALWGAVRESALLACNNPAHQYHNVLDCDDSQKLPSVWKDCVRVMNKILSIVDNEISIPVKLMDEVKKFE